MLLKYLSVVKLLLKRLGKNDVLLEEYPEELKLVFIYQKLENFRIKLDPLKYKEKHLNCKKTFEVRNTIINFF